MYLILTGKVFNSEPVSFFSCPCRLPNVTNSIDIIVKLNTNFFILLTFLVPLSLPGAVINDTLNYLFPTRQAFRESRPAEGFVWLGGCHVLFKDSMIQ
jgi:hypothetical protein